MNRHIKYPSIPYFNRGQTISGKIYEKIDGSNVQVRKIGEHIIPGTRSKSLKEYKQKCNWMEKFEKDIKTNESLKYLKPDHIIFLEYLSNHSINYERFKHNAIFIDLFDLRVNKFIDYEESKKIIKSSNIQGFEMLEVIQEGTFSFKDLEKLCLEKYNTQQDFEGFVIKGNETVKIVVEQIDEIFDELVKPHLSGKIKSRKEIEEIISQVHKTSKRMLHFDIVCQKLEERRYL